MPSKTRSIDADGKILGELPVALGTSTTVAVALKDPITVTAHKRAFPKAVSEIIYDAPLRAPIKEGDEIARLVVTVDGKKPIIAPLVCDQWKRSAKFSSAKRLPDLAP